MPDIASGTGSLNIPIATSQGRSGFEPQLSLAYDSGAGNGAFGLEWSLSLPSITRKTDKGLPRYRDGEESDVFGRGMLKIGLGLAVPSIEAWYRCGIDTHVNEATWASRLRGERITYTRKTLKRDAYGMDRAPLSVMTAAAARAAAGLVDNLELLERLFPGGFGSFARDLRSW